MQFGNLWCLTVVCRDSVSRCNLCTAEASCGYCLSTLQCSEGTGRGPVNGSPCPSWTFDGSICPGIVLLSVYAVLILAKMSQIVEIILIVDHVLEWRNVHGAPLKNCVPLCLMPFHVIAVGSFSIPPVLINLYQVSNSFL